MKRPAPSGYFNFMLWTDRGFSRHFTVPRRWLRRLWIGSLCAAIVALFLAGRYVFLELQYQHRAKMEQMRTQFEQLQGELKKGNQKGEKLERQLEDLNKKLNGASYAPPQEDTEQRFVTPPSLDFSAAGIEDMVEQTSQLVDGLTLLENRVAATERELDSRLNKLDSIPSTYPVTVPSVSSGFGWRPNPTRRGFSDFHPGYDFRGNPGDRVYATASGTVTFAGWDAGYGRTVEIDHANGFTTVYAHCSTVLVREGAHVKKGQVIARLGSSGRSTGPHVHYEVQYHGGPINPAPFLGLSVSRLPDVLRRYKG